MIGISVSYLKKCLKMDIKRGPKGLEKVPSKCNAFELPPDLPPSLPRAFRAWDPSLDLFLFRSAGGALSVLSLSLSSPPPSSLNARCWIALFLLESPPLLLFVLRPPRLSLPTLHLSSELIASTKDWAIYRQGDNNGGGGDGTVGKKWHSHNKHD